MSAQMRVKNISPLVHSLDLKTVASLAGTLRKISLRPFSIAGCDLPRAFAWVFPVVSLIKLEVFVIVVLGIQISLVGIVWPTVRQTRIIEPARLLTALKIHPHSFRISFKFSYPNLFRREKVKPLVQDFGTELGKSLESLKRVSWRDLLCIDVNSS